MYDFTSQTTPGHDVVEFALSIDDVIEDSKGKVGAEFEDCFIQYSPGIRTT
jgi:hypothetical protein